jgi:hypothetical protein
MPIQPKLVLLFKLSNRLDVSIVVELKKLVVKFGMQNASKDSKYDCSVIEQ